MRYGFMGVVRFADDQPGRKRSQGQRETDGTRQCCGTQTDGEHDKKKQLPALGSRDSFQKRRNDF